MSKCTDCLIDLTDACPRGSGRAIDDEICDSFISNIKPLDDNMEDAYDRGYQQGRADVLREHREQCNGKCLKCEVSVPFVNSDGEEVILPYSYSYKTDCEDNRYINAKEVLSLIKQARADAIDEYKKAVLDAIVDAKERGEEHCVLKVFLDSVAEQLKEQKE